MNILRLLTRILIIAAIAFVFWFVGGELFYSTLSGIMPPRDFTTILVVDIIVGIILGIVYGIVLIKILPGLLPYLSGTIIGAFASLAISTNIGSIANPLTKVVGIIFFLAPGAILNMLVISKLRSRAATTRAPTPETPKPSMTETAKAETSPQSTQTSPQEQLTKPAEEKPQEIGPEHPLTSVSGSEKQLVEQPKVPAQQNTTMSAPEQEIKPKSEHEIITEDKGEYLVQEIPEEKIVTPITDEDLEEKILEVIEKEGLTEIVPLPSNLSPEGGFYPDIEEKVGIETSKLLSVFKSLTDRGILKQSGVEFKKIVCPRCLSALNIINIGCPFCKSINIARQRILQHESCGFLGPEERFTESGKTICPRCGAEVEIIRGQSEEVGKEILKVHSTLFTCYNCNEVSTEPYVSFRCLTCGMIYDLVTFESKSFYRYSVNLDALYKALELKKPIKIIVEEMSKRGIEVQQQVMITGASKVPHKVNLLFRKDGRVVGGAILITDKGESHLHEIMRVLVLRTDAGIKNLYVLSYYKLDDDARKLAQFNEIPVIEDVLSKDAANEILPRMLKSILEQ